MVEVETWFQEEGRVAACRNWLFRDASSGRQLGRATRHGARTRAPSVALGLCKGLLAQPSHRLLPRRCERNREVQAAWGLSEAGVTRAARGSWSTR